MPVFRLPACQGEQAKAGRQAEQVAATTTTKAAAAIGKRLFELPFFAGRQGQAAAFFLCEQAKHDRIEQATEQMKEGDSIGRIEKQNLWRTTKAKQYTMRIMYETGIPEAIEQAAAKAEECQSQYIKKSIVMRLRSEGFLSGEVVTNRTEQRHKERIQRLKEYIAAEEAKQKK